MTCGQRQPATTPRPDVPDEPTPAEESSRPATKWEVIRWDLLVFLLATAGFVVNYLSPDALSSALMLAFFLAMVWVAYRIHTKLQSLRGTSRK